MNLILQSWFDKGVAVHLDDIIIYCKSPEEHIRFLELILARLAEHQLFVKWSKCKIGVPTIELLGHIISYKDVQPDPGKIESIRLWPVPTSVYENYVFLGMAGYYSRFIRKYAKTAVLTDLLKKINKWQCTTAALESFE